ncbi:MAG: ATP-binding protein, partial [Oscillospiraceae bacterium]
MANKKQQYNNESISTLKGAERVRKRPGVIFGSDGIDGCQHSVFEIISNSLDEAREGYGKKIIITRYLDHSIEVEDFGRGIPVDYNNKEQEYNWRLLFCEMYAGGKYDNTSGSTYEFSLGLNGLGLCATQYASEYMDVEIYRDGFRFFIQFKEGNPVGDMLKEPTNKKQTGSRIRWKPDLKVFTDINISDDYFTDMLRRQAVVNGGIEFLYKNETAPNLFKDTEFLYRDGIVEYANEIVGEDALTPIQFIEGERVGRDREDLPDYKVKMSFAFCFSNKTQMLEYYHNSSWLEHGGSPDKAVKSAFRYQIDALIKERKLYKKDEKAITFDDIQDCLVMISSSFSTETSYENQTKKSITNKFIAQAMIEFLKHNLEIYFIENRIDADKIANQILINKRSRENAEKTRLNLKKTLQNSS